MWSYITTGEHTQEGRQMSAHEKHKHTGMRIGTRGLIGEQSVIHTLLGSRASFKGVSIFRPEQLDTSEMDQAHQSPAHTGALNTMAGLAALVSVVLPVSQIEINELPTLTAG